jgi:hypothetical protein
MTSSTVVLPFKIVRIENKNNIFHNNNNIKKDEPFFASFASENRPLIKRMALLSSDESDGAIVKSKRKLCEIAAVDNADCLLPKNKTQKLESDDALSIDAECVKEHDDDDDDDEMSENSLWLLANEYDDLLEWKTLGASLSLSAQDLQQIECKYLSKEGPRECLYQALLKWRLREPENCHLKYFLVDILRNKLSKSEEFLARLSQKLSKNDDQNESSKKKLNFYLKQLLIKTKHRKNETLVDCSIRLSERDLWRASDFLCTEWKSVLRGLNASSALSESHIVQLESKYLHINNQCGVRECCYQALLLWSEVSGAEQANLEHLCLSLLSSGLNFYAKKLLELVLF